MQLTKDDIFEVDDERCCIADIKIVLIFSKFQQIVEFYEKYQKYGLPLFKDEQPELHKKFNEYLMVKCKLKTDIELDGFKAFMGHKIKSSFTDWLFSYCFKDGLK